MYTQNYSPASIYLTCLFISLFVFYFIIQGANEGGKNYGDEYLAELDYVEVVEGIKEGYESDVPETDTPTSPEEDKKEANGVSDEEDNTKENTNDSDEDFNIDNYVSYSKDLLDTTESSSIRCDWHQIRISLHKLIHYLQYR